MTEQLDVRVLQERVRSDRHATSFPLIAIGAVGFHYASFQLNGWVPITYGLPLAFVVVWALQRYHERRHGVGSGNDQVLAIAFAVFLGTSLVLSETWRSLLPGHIGDRILLWVFLPAAAGLAALGWRQRNPMIVAWSAAIPIACVLGESLSGSSLALRWNDTGGAPYQALLPQAAFLTLTLAGILRLRSEAATRDA
jgi:hypothetical protein